MLFPSRGQQPEAKGPSPRTMVRKPQSLVGSPERGIAGSPPGKRKPPKPEGSSGLQSRGYPRCPDPVRPPRQGHLKRRGTGIATRPNQRRRPSRSASFASLGYGRSTLWPPAAPRSLTLPPSSSLPSSPTCSTWPPQPPSTGRERTEQSGHTTPRNSPGPAITRPDEDTRLNQFQAQVFGMGRTLLSTSLDAGVSLRDVQEAALHADPRTTMRHQVAPAAASSAHPGTGASLAKVTARSTCEVRYPPAWQRDR
jgi:hypothetical protein